MLVSFMLNSLVRNCCDYLGKFTMMSQPLLLSWVFGPMPKNQPSGQLSNLYLNEIFRRICESTDISKSYSIRCTTTTQRVGCGGFSYTIMWSLTAHVEVQLGCDNLYADILGIVIIFFCIE